VQHHYRTPLDIDRAHIASAARAYTKLIKAFNPDALPVELVPYQQIQQLWQKLAAECEQANAILDALADDSNIPKMLGLLFGSMDVFTATQERRQAVRLFLQQVLGLTLQPLHGVEQVSSEEITALIAERDQARREQNWKRADELRAQLHELGHTVVDTKLSA